MNTNFKSFTGDKANKKMLMPVLVWLFVYIGIRMLVRNLEIPQVASIILSLLPSVVFVWVMISFIKNVSLMDELNRRIYLEASAIAFSLCLILIMTLGMLSLVITLDRDDWDYRHLIPFLFIFYFIGLAITKKKYLG